MNYYLVVFNRQLGSVVSMSEFEDSAVALEGRFEAEAKHHGRAEIEVVVLGAESVEALQSTHGRYFQSVDELATSGIGALGRREAA